MVVGQWALILPNWTAKMQAAPSPPIPSMKLPATAYSAEEATRRIKQAFAGI